MAAAGWKQLIPSMSIYRGEGKYAIDAYSEFMPPPRLGWKPYFGEQAEPPLFSADDPWGWRVNEYEEAHELGPGLRDLGRQLIGRLRHLHQGNPAHAIARRKLADNLHWPPELAQRAGRLDHEHCVILLPLALSKTQDDKGRVHWTLFGCSEQGPAKAFWKGFYTAPGQEVPAEEGLRFIRDLLSAAFGEQVENTEEIRRAGFRILPQNQPTLDFWEEGPLPGWSAPFLLQENGPFDGVKYLLSFRTFAQLPAAIRSAYLAGKLHLLPCPGSLLCWGVPQYIKLHEELPLALQVPLLHLFERRRAFRGLRVPQAGYFHEASPNQPVPAADAGPFRSTFKRTHRWDRILRDQDELALLQREDKILHVLFSSIPDDLGLYDKPMARNAQVWTDDFRLLMDGPQARPTELKKAFEAVLAGGTFGYRMMYPPMRVGRHEVFWHRPLVAFHCREKDEAVVVASAPLGYLTAYAAGRPRLDKPIELWPRISQRPIPLSALRLASAIGHERGRKLARNVRKLHDAFDQFTRPLPRSFARQLLTLNKEETLESWLDSLPDEDLNTQVRALIEPLSGQAARVPDSLTYQRSARRSFELAYWKTIAHLAESRFLNKNNADCVRDATTQNELPYHRRQLDDLGDYLLGYYGKCIAAAGMKGKALAGEIPVRWRTDFDFCWMGGWLKNQDGPGERDLLIAIPGRDRGRAVIMADHYDTAYMEDRYEKESGGRGARLAACGADDNHSASAALMLAAPIFLELSRAGRLGCDIWLVHLTGEEFPADCLGARALTQRLVEGTLALHLPGGKRKDLSKVRVQGLYVSDMIAHNNDRDRDVFQMAPGTSRTSLWLAYQAHVANEIWNASVEEWNQRSDRSGKMRGRRSPHAAAVPEIAPHLALSGEVRPVSDPKSTLYNTDGQIFSDAGVPVVLFMENYDINRSGYHDTRDTMANIDLDYGAALTAIVIESVARAATETPWD